MTVRGGLFPVEAESHPQPIPERQNASLRFVTPGYFSVMGIRMIAGRDVADADTLDTPLVIVISQSFAKRYWPNEDPIGRRTMFGNRTRMVVGIVGDVRVRGLERTSEPRLESASRSPRTVTAETRSVLTRRSTVPAGRARIGSPARKRARSSESA